MSRRYLAYAATLATTLLFGPSAGAVDAKVYSGAICKSVYPSPWSYDDGVYRAAYGLRIGDGQTAAYISCPLARDVTTNTDGLSDLEVSVDNSSGAMWCSATSHDRYGNTLDSHMISAPSGTNQVLNFGSTINVSSAKGSYHLFCAMSLNDYIHSIVVEEF